MNVLCNEKFCGETLKPGELSLFQCWTLAANDGERHRETIRASAFPSYCMTQMRALSALAVHQA
jgi:hypothetical protein